MLKKFYIPGIEPSDELHIFAIKLFDGCFDHILMCKGQKLSQPATKNPNK